MRVSLRKVIWSDFGALLCLLAPVVVLLLACEDRTLGVLGPWLSRNRMQPGEASAFLGMAGTGLAAVSLLLLIARLRTFRLCFAHGVLVPGIEPGASQSRGEATATRCVCPGRGARGPARRGIRGRAVRSLRCCVDRPARVVGDAAA